MYSGMQVKNLIWDITYECNLRCIHCYNSKKIDNRRNEYLLNNGMLSETCKKIYDIGINHVHLLGGEPFVEKKIYELIESLNNYNIEVTINTNGTIINEDLKNVLLKNQIQQLTISLDGGTREDNDSIRGEGSFETVCNNIKLLNEFISKHRINMKINVATVLTRKNYKNIIKLPGVIRGLGGANLQILSLYNCGRACSSSLEISASEYLEAILFLIYEGYRNNITLQFDCKPRVIEELKKKIKGDESKEIVNDTCMAGKTIVYMDAYGNIYPCGPISQNEKISWQYKEKFNDPNILCQINKYTDKVKESIKVKKIDEFCESCRFLAQCNECVCCTRDNRLCKEACYLKTI